MRLLVRYCDDNGFETFDRTLCGMNGIIEPFTFVVVVIVLNSCDSNDDELCNVRTPAAGVFATAKLHPTIPRLHAMTDLKEENIEHLEYHHGEWNNMSVIVASYDGT